MASKEYHKEYDRRYYHKHRERLRQRRKKYYRDHREQELQLCRKYQLGYYQGLDGKYSRYKGSAKARNLPFTLTKEQFLSLWQQPCSYCGSAIETIGLDRLDNSKGYIAENVIPCCWRCNDFKSDLSVQEFLDLCRKIINHYKSL